MSTFQRHFCMLPQNPLSEVSSAIPKASVKGLHLNRNQGLLNSNKNISSLDGGGENPFLTKEPRCTACFFNGRFTNFTTSFSYRTRGHCYVVPLLITEINTCH